MRFYLGLDSSTQSLSAVVLDLDSGRIVQELSLNFGTEFPEFNCPQGFLVHPDPLVRHADPLVWVAALDRVCEKLKAAGVDLAAVVGISGSGQQHGTAYLNDAFAANRVNYDAAGDLASAIRPCLTRKSAPIWMDSSTTAECQEIATAAGGAEKVRQITGSPPIERFSGPQIRKFYKDDPAAYGRTAVIHLVSSFMASVLTGRSCGIDFGDGAGMNLLNLQDGAWDAGMLAATAPGLAAKLPPAVPASARAGDISTYFVKKYGFRAGTPVLVFSGDNPCSLIGVGAAKPGVVVVSLGTSHTLFAAMDKAVVDPDGCGHVFGNPAGGFMSLICFKNGALALEQVRDQFKLDWAGVEKCLATTPAGNNGNVMLPYFVPEITPVVLNAKPVYRGSAAFCSGTDTAAVIRAVCEAQALRLRLHSAWMGQKTTSIRVTGGAAKNRGFCQVIADVFNARVERLETGNSAALGAAMRAAQGVGGQSWEQLTATFCKPVDGGAIDPIAANVRTYDHLLPEFAAFAKQGR